ncbi:MAG: AarF/ABC1/UbiB kinase family protein [Thermodesulfovibrionia bacterium]|nr:AarF/ABC1/UbiB kinase family protein [Thermodesulfovibrionia bacterium]
MTITSLLRFWNTYKNINRIRQIVNVLLKHGFGQFIEQINLKRFIPLRKRIKYFARWQEVERHTIPERLRMAFSELGPSFIKLAQILSTRPDLITGEYANEFKKLLDRVPPFSSGKARQIIESELNISLNDVFSDFDDFPVAAASIAQVHNATLKTGEKVIVKIQRPDIREIIEMDLIILNAIARLMLRYIPESKFFDPKGIVNEFSRSVKKEVDFIIEAKNAQRFKRNFAENPDICIPYIYTDLLSGKVIVMERLEGIRIDDIKGIDSLGIDRSELAKKGVDAYFKMIFEDGFFHADPHPGNIFVMPDGRIGLLDYGIIGWLTPDMMENIAGAFLAVLKKDFDRLVDLYIELGLVAEEIDIDKFKKEFRADLVYLLEPLYDLAISEVNFPEYLEAVTHLVIKHGLTVPSDLLLMNKTILILDNIGRQLDPDFNAVKAAEPYAVKLVKQRVSPQRLIDKTGENLSAIGELLFDTPKQMNKLLRKTMKDEVGFKIDLTGMEKFRKDIDRSSNRLAFSVIVAAIIIGSSMLIQSGIGEKVLGLPALGATGFLVAILLGLWLLISILRSGRL